MVVPRQNITQWQIPPQLLPVFQLRFLEVVGLVTSYTTVEDMCLSHENSGGPGSLLR